MGKAELRALAFDADFFTLPNKVNGFGVGAKNKQLTGRK
jgi:hypothetical protein